ncbi:TAXI family TRAP transporter solute-binding subunit [Glycomyces sp. YM15]|uniref:TAXI family TRAP transporter solute-binding subunit n=1 Tax=Glycomyces sp. YM15 TaxID=2800446 RepID=UPI001963CEE5|nr:TAXI family TRAP transporter solute-binding subunit [Glycomyces sp. YM15]
MNGIATRLIGRLAAVLLVALSAGCSDSAEAPPLSIATGEAGGVYYAYGTGIAELLTRELDTEVAVVETAASLENLRMVVEGEADLCFALADAAALAVDGQAPFGEAQPLTALARLYDNYTHLVVDADLPIATLDDLRGHAVAVGAEHSGAELMADRLLDIAGIDPQTDITALQLSLAESLEALRSGRIAAFFWSGGLPTTAIAEFAESEPIRLISLSEYVAPLRERYGELFSELSIPAHTYGQAEAVATVGVPNLLLVHESMDAELAQDITESLFEKRLSLREAHPEAEHLNVRVAIATYPVALHPGAVAYYRGSKPHL